MKTTTLLIATLLYFLNASAQTSLKMEPLNGHQVMPCKVNGLAMKFIIDTGDSLSSISISDALFMLKNGYITMTDISGTEYDRFSLGHIGYGTKLIIKNLEIGNNEINNVMAIVVPDLRTPLVLGQSELNKLGRIEFDYANQMLTIRNKKDFAVNSAAPVTTLTKSVNYNGNSMPPKSNFDNPDQTVSASLDTATQKKFLVKVKTNLYTQPENGHSIVQVNSNTIVNLIGDVTDDQNFVYVDYMGKKGYINRLALEKK